MSAPRWSVLLNLGHIVNKISSAVGFAVRPATNTPLAEVPGLVAGEGLASADAAYVDAPNGSHRMRTDGLPETKIGGTWRQYMVGGQTVADEVWTYVGDGNDVGWRWTGSAFDLIPAADDTVWNIGNGTLSFDLNIYGNIPTAYMGWDASANLLSLNGPVRTNGMNVIPKRFQLLHIGGQRGKPSLNADINSATEATREIADPDFELLGTNATSGSSTFNAEGGIKLTTAGADNDQVILLPHLDTNQTAWSSVTWGTDKETSWECEIATDSSIAACIIWAGLKLTNTPTAATDDNQVFFRYQSGVNDGEWQLIYSIGGTDTTVDAGVVVAVSTIYHLKVVIDSSRIARCYINGVLVATSTALTNTTDFIPYIGVQASGAAAAKAITYYGQGIGRNKG